MRLKKIDLFKGILILLVILGHIIQGNSNEIFIKYLIYSFHMPLFIGISGFLFNYNTNYNLTLPSFLLKYSKRLIIPWLLASIAYIIFNYFAGILQNVSFYHIFKALAIPYFHLWFIPAYLSWVVICWICIKLKFPIIGILVISIIISTTSYFLFVYQHNYEKFPPMNNFIITMLGTFRPHLFVFFVLGFFLKNTGYFTNKIKTLEIVITILLLAAIIEQFFNNSRMVQFTTFFLFNFVLLINVLKMTNKSKLPGISSIEWIGQNSLGIYLWHVFPILITINVLGKDNHSLNFYVTAILLEIIFIMLYVRLTKLKWINTWFFGITESAKNLQKTIT